MAQDRTETALRGSDVHDRNRRLRSSYLELEELARQADRSGDSNTASKVRDRMASIANRFVELNSGLIGSSARRFRTTDSRSSWQDFDAAGIEGLWEAFLKWDPDATHVNPKTGKRGRVTFATFAKSYIDGKVMREVNRIERPQLKYHAFSDAAHVRDVELELTESLGGIPSNDELAEAASAKLGRTITTEKVALVRTKRPVALDAPRGSEGDGTVADTLAAPVGEVADLVDDQLIARAAVALDTRALFVLLLTQALHGGVSVSVNEAAALTGIGRETVRKLRLDAERVLAEALLSEMTASDAFSIERQLGADVSAFLEQFEASDETTSADADQTLFAM